MMPNEEVSIDIILQDKTGKKIDSATVVATTDIPGEHTFRDLPPGEYIVDRILPNGHIYIDENPSKHNLINEKSDLYVGIFFIGSSSSELGAVNEAGQSGQDDRSESPVPEPILIGVVLVTAAAIWSTDVAVFLGFAPSTAPFQSSQMAQIEYQRLNRSTSTTDRNVNRLPPDLEESLSKCLEEAVKSQSELLEKAKFLNLTLDPFGVTIDPAKVAQYLVNEARQNSGNLDQEQQDSSDPAVVLIRGLKEAIEDCNPGLIQKIIEAETREDVDSTIVNDSQTASPQTVKEPAALECCLCVDNIPLSATNCP
ncbi:prealbumin-like fold domain-containing protein [Leptolyngbya ohadii]|uniref:prealbumin-like fold domain-containing protein n=1 Tax=Leptolyngbya ohadii TaxID=1962290 RepID=UPI000B59D828|nr:prealbumin-like fold domain-containing protein [Leptolyngbya ohadii]